MRNLANISWRMQLFLENPKTFPPDFLLYLRLSCERFRIPWFIQVSRFSRQRKPLYVGDTEVRLRKKQTSHRLTDEIMIICWTGWRHKHVAIIGRCLQVHVTYDGFNHYRRRVARIYQQHQTHKFKNQIWGFFKNLSRTAATLSKDPITRYICNVSEVHLVVSIKIQLNRHLAAMQCEIADRHYNHSLISYVTVSRMQDVLGNKN